MPLHRLWRGSLRWTCRRLPAQPLGTLQMQAVQQGESAPVMPLSKPHKAMEDKQNQGLSHGLHRVLSSLLPVAGLRLQGQSSQVRCWAV